VEIRQGGEPIMPHAFVKIWIHAVLRTKNKTVIIPPDLRPTLNQQIKNILTEQNCKVRIVNSVKITFIVSSCLRADTDIARVIKNHQRISSHWIKS
jgi:hypothetical protein